jgi:hypothetical protein
MRFAETPVQRTTGGIPHRSRVGMNLFHARAGSMT